MRFSIGIALLGLAMTGALAACAGHEGNPNGQPYAGDPDGVIAVQPQTVGGVAYNPYAKPAPFTDMQAGQAAISPSPTPPLNLTPQGAR